MSAWFQATTDYWKAGGPLLIFIALVSVGIWGLFLRSRKILRQLLNEGEPLAGALDRGELGTNEGGMSAALTEHRGGLAAILRNALGDIRRGARPLEAFAARENECLQYLKHDFVILAALTAVAPLLGLLGTVIGMVETFDAASSISGGTESRVAMGISSALITTQFGLVMALPGMFGLAHLQRLTRHIKVLMATCRTLAVNSLESGKGRAIISS